MAIVSKHLKDLNNGVLRFLKHLVDLHFGAEGHPIIIFIGRLLTGDTPTSNGCLRSADITEETTSEGVWQAYQILGDCWGE